MLNIGGWELLIILLVALVFLGPERLPGAARQLGQTVSQLRALAQGFQQELEAATKLPDAETAPKPPEVGASASEAAPVVADTGRTEPEVAAEQEPPPSTDPEAIRQAVNDSDPFAKHVIRDQSPGGPASLKTNGTVPTDHELADSAAAEISAEDVE